MGIFQRLNVEQGITVILVTHEPDIAEHCRRVVHMYDGEIRSDEQVADRRAWPATRRIKAGSGDAATDVER